VAPVAAVRPGLVDEGEHFPVAKARMDVVDRRRLGERSPPAEPAQPLVLSEGRGILQVLGRQRRTEQIALLGDRALAGDPLLEAGRGQVEKEPAGIYTLEEEG